MLQLLVTGMHLSPEFGMTVGEIEGDGIPIAERVEILLSSDSAVGVSKAMGLALIGFADSFARLRPDIVVVLGDRFEVFAAAAAALVAGIPIAHIHGGESTEGAIDEAFRHSITKMAHLHFVAAEPYRNRVIQLGEAPERVFVVGGLGIDAIRSLPLLDRAELAESLDFDLGDRFLLVTFHPPTASPGEAGRQMHALLDALATLDPAIRLVFTMPNADTGGREIAAHVARFAATRENVRAYKSLGQLRYLSAMRLSAGVIGNSSSGLIEAPTFRVGTVNIGDRQTGRLKAGSVIDCAPQRTAIEAALDELFSPLFQAALAGVKNPYGDGGAADRIVEVLQEHPLDVLHKKRFHDLDPVRAAGSTGGLEE